MQRWQRVARRHPDCRVDTKRAAKAVTYPHRERDGKVRAAPFSLRLTGEERTQLLSMAGGVSLGAYIKAALFADGAARVRKSPRVPVGDQIALAEVLARLGASRLASNLNQLAHQANLGTLDVDAGVAAALVAACEEVRVMRLILMRALGLKPDEVKAPRPRPQPKSAPPSPVSEFTVAAAPKTKRITL